MQKRIRIEERKAKVFRQSKGKDGQIVLTWILTGKRR